jgi:hypothetical protein
MDRIIKMADEKREFVMLEDGFVYYWPAGAGAISSHQLRQLADELDRRNEDWNKQINEYFDEAK